MNNDFIVWLSFHLKNKKYFIFRDLENYFDKKNNFDKKLFFQNNYIFFDEKNYEINKKILTNKNLENLNYLFFSNIKNIHNLNNYFSGKFLNDIDNNIFFIDWWKYKIYDEEQNLVKTLYFSNKKANFWYSSFELDEEEINFTLLPSKIIWNQYLENILNDIENYFPLSIKSDIEESFKIPKKNRNIKDYKKLLTIIKYIESAHIITTTKIKIQKIKKSEFDPIKHELNNKITNYIIEKWWFDKIKDDEEFEIEEKISITDNEENRYILESLYYIKDTFQTNFVDNLIKNFTDLNISKTRKNQDKISQKLLNNPVYSSFVKIVEEIKKKNIESDYKIDDKNLRDFDKIKSLNDIYEIYCFIKFYNFLDNIWIHFFDSIKDSIYDKNAWNVVKYEENTEKWFLRWSYQKKNIKLFFWDKIFEKNKRNYELMKENNFSFIEKSLSKVSANWLTPDITFEIWKEIIICDVKFSCFKDLETWLDFPNPNYFTHLQKYRKILINWKFYSKPIIIFYPWEYTDDNYKDFLKMFNLILITHNVFLFPILNENNLINKFLKEEFLKIL